MSAKTVCPIEDDLYNPQLRGFVPFESMRLVPDAKAKVEDLIRPYWIDSCRAHYRRERDDAVPIDLGGEG